MIEHLRHLLNDITESRQRIEEKAEQEVRASNKYSYLAGGYTALLDSIQGRLEVLIKQNEKLEE